MRTRILLLTTIFCLLFSCNKKETPVLPEVAKVDKYTQLAKAKWLIGRWENNSASGNLSEIWTRKNDSAFTAEAYFVIKNDTVFNESVELVEDNGKLLYTVTVPTENMGKAVAFTSSEIKDNQMIFTNPNHDYPSQIVYKMPTRDSLIATISGQKGGTAKSEIFAMKRVK